MNMELLFRGQTRRFGEKLKNVRGDPLESNWVYGGLFQGKGDFSIIYTYNPIEKKVVYTESVGQYIWKYDADGEKIFTGDILDDGQGSRGTVTLDEENSRFVLLDGLNVIGFDEIFSTEYRVVGNVFDSQQRKAFYERHKELSEEKE